MTDRFSSGIRRGDYYLLPLAGQPHELLVRAEWLGANGWNISYPAKPLREHTPNVYLGSSRRVTPKEARAILRAAPSPHDLVQERVSRDLHYPWRVIACCALLNRTQGAQVRPMLERFFAELVPQPEKIFQADMRPLLEPLGLYSRREDLLRRLTWDYLAGAQPAECFGVGEYGRDAVALFVHGEQVHASAIADRWLRRYAQWRARGGWPLLWDRPAHSAWRKRAGFAPLARKGTT